MSGYYWDRPDEPYMPELREMWEAKRRRAETVPGGFRENYQFRKATVRVYRKTVFRGKVYYEGNQPP